MPSSVQRTRDPRVETGPAGGAGAARVGERPASPLERAVLVTVAYGDLFDYPLTADELHGYVSHPCPRRCDLDAAVAALTGGPLTRSGPFVHWSGRDAIVAVRRRRETVVASRWPDAVRYARWLSRVPFVRMVGVCGSQAAGNARPDGDIDVVCITEGGRLWVVQIVAMLLRRLASRLGAPVCPNYFLTSRTLELDDRNLYTAREVAQVVPVWGRAEYDRFRRANGWVKDFLPNLGDPDRSRLLPERRRPIVTRAVEWLLGGRLGESIDACLHRVLLRYYALRLRRLGWTRAELRRHYQRERQVVMMGGYGPVVAERLAARLRAAMDPGRLDDELARLFPGPRPPETSRGDRLFARLMDERYGAANG